MHELSIVMGIVDIALEYAEREQATAVDEIEIDIGRLSTVEMQAFDAAWTQGVRNTVLAGASKIINRIAGEASCSRCDSQFPIDNVYDACPACGEHFIVITKGKELRVKSLVVSR